MNSYSLKWNRIFTQTAGMSMNDKEVMFKTNTILDPDIVMLHKIMYYEESIMKKGSHNFYGILLQLASKEVILYIKTSFNNLTTEQIESTVLTDQKMLQNVENLMKILCDKWGLDVVDKKYGQLRWTLIKDNERYKSNVMTVWTSIFSFFWLVTSMEESINKLTEKDMKYIIQAFHNIVGYEEFKIFSLVCLCAHRLFCVLPNGFANLLELAVSM